MSELITPSNIMFSLGIIGTLFTIFNYFNNPQKNSEKNDALLDQRVQWDKDSNDKRFAEMGERMTSALTLAQNHIHTVDTKVDSVIHALGLLSNEVTKLATIIDERVPKK